MAPATKTVVVTGCTGNQGGGALAALLPEANAGKLLVRGISRNADSAKAKALQAQPGVEIVAGDMGDRDSLVKAFSGADQLFLVTDFYGGAKGDASVELQHGKNAIDAAKEAGISFIVLSTLEHLAPEVIDALPNLHDGNVIPHFQSKAAIEDYLRESGVPYALLLTCMFYENVINFTGYQKTGDGSYMYGDNLGTAPHGWHAVGDIGQSAAVIFKDPAKHEGKTVIVVGERITHPQMASILSEVTGKTVKYAQMTDEQYAALPFPAAAELANMYRYYREWPLYDDKRPLDKRVYKGPSFKEWAAQNRAQIVQKIESS